MFLFSTQGLIQKVAQGTFLISRATTVHPPNPKSTSPLGRCIHLLQDIYAPSKTTPTYITPLVDLAWKRLPDVSQAKLRLVDDGKKGVGPILRFSDVQARLKYGQYLQKLEPYVDEDPAVIAAYRVSQIPYINQKTKAAGNNVPKLINFVRAGRGKEVHLTSDASVNGYRGAMRNSYRFLNEGCRVELHVHVKVGELDRRASNILDTVFIQNPHLMPELILRGMPEGTSIICDPLLAKGGKEMIGKKEKKEKKGKKEKKEKRNREQLIWVMSNEQKWNESREATGSLVAPSHPPDEHAMRILETLPVLE
ncbi:MAG: hypothetical protein Q9225_002219 [Loekoesia sp. 1 TL-2023]